MRNPLISVIIVNYRADEHVQRLLKTLTPDKTLEVIVIDNSDGQQGYGAGCNVGARQASGEYLVWLNPDLILQAEDIHALVEPLIHNPSLGAVGPQLRSEDGQIQITCSAIPTPWMSAVIYSWLEKLNVFRWEKEAYRLFGFSHSYSRLVPSISGACIAMRRSTWEKIGGFDEKLFLYFEEFDLCTRLRQKKLGVYFCVDVSMVHLGQVSTTQVAGISAYFRRSRRYWLRKAYGVWGWLAAEWLEINELPKQLRSS